MRALVVYESMYGNTLAVATDVAAGLRATHDVTLVPVTRATRELVAMAGLIVAGAPTHRYGMPTIASRRMAAEAARTPDSGLTMDADANGPGLRAWLEALGAEGVLAAAFDTRLSGMPALTGRASRAIARVLTRRGCRVLLAPESFLVSGQNTLLDGEAARACTWGALVGETAHAAFATSKRSWADPAAAPA
jgi:Flavodoxin